MLTGSNGLPNNNNDSNSGWEQDSTERLLVVELPVRMAGIGFIHNLGLGRKPKDLQVSEVINLLSGELANYVI